MATARRYPAGNQRPRDSYVKRNLRLALQALNRVSNNAAGELGRAELESLQRISQTASTMIAGMEVAA